ncbi:precorrin-2 dehydrogenase/sirohydrochlorin ferrochelatase family protein [Novosphingobium panipatense]|uniref:precorrin-2 dehydrogenase n=1 Tax=Novosphingobium panipatense TaxID=428991 RepID=A0ABY1QHU3_9SPHN|nr:siroheme synthase [Novosphingobium panipatense]SMP69602.1 uroporphyrin-III C-methyltransferase / precorrin-2 dehydrogenase / sirohydrochlorin ferrochelatase [Novosphingobium panipatense]
MIDALPLFHRIAGKPVVVLGDGDAAEAKRRLVERAGALVLTTIEDGEAQGARLAFVAHEDDASAQADVDRARRAGMLVNATDRPALCDFTVPSILDRSPVLVAVGTGGASAGLAKQLRLRLEVLLPQSLGSLATGLRGARAALRERFPDAVARRRAIDDALATGGVLDPLAENGASRVQQWLAGARATGGGSVEIRLRSEDPDDLTLREARLLGTADVVLHDEDIGAQILDRVRADAVRRSLAEGTPPASSRALTVILRRPL